MSSPSPELGRRGQGEYRTANKQLSKTPSRTHVPNILSLPIRRSRRFSQLPSPAGILEAEAHVYCPQCRAEYDDDVTECSNCHTPLLIGTHGPNELVVVLETTDRIQFAMAKGLLDDAKIPLFVHGQIATLYQSVDPFLRKLLRLQVPRDREAEARDLLGQLLQPIPPDA
jgi:Putative prokaryotic signal transducing protein/zinc-ribbon domain